MLKHYFKIIFRNIFRNKIYTLINLLGLSSGIAASLILFLYVQHELSFDQFHVNKDQIYRIISIGQKTANIEARSPYKLSPILTSVFPEIQSSCRVREREHLIKKGSEFILEKNIIQADSSFFDLFSFNILIGDQTNTLNDDNSIALSESTAKKYFSDSNPIGQIIEFSYKDKTYHQKVTAVFEDIPTNSHIQADFILPISTTIWGYENIDRKKSRPSFESWYSNGFLTYIQLPENYDTKLLIKKLPEFIKSQLPKTSFSGHEFSYTYDLQPLNKIHLFSMLMSEDVANKGNLKHIYLFGGISILILIIAIINYIILSTAKSLSRTKEIGLRKVMGATRAKIMKQVLGESIFISLLSLPFALLFSNLFLPQINDLLGVSINFKLQDNSLVAIALIAICLITGLISGSYIAFYLSSFKPIDVFRSQINLGLKGSLFQKSLIIVQLVIFIGLLICSGIIYKQVEYMNKNEVLGYKKENLISILTKNRNVAKKFRSFKAELLTHPDIQFVSSSFCYPPSFKTSISASGSSIHPESGKKSWYTYRGGFPENTKDMMIYESNNVDYDYVETMGMEIVKGRSFDKKDKQGYTKVMVNEQFIKEFNVPNPTKEKFKFTDTNLEIVGVIKDFHSNSLTEKIKSVLFFNNSKYIRQLIIRTTGENTSSTLSFIEEKWKDFFPNTSFEYSFTNAHIESMYKTEMNLAKLIGSFAILAILIASLGLYGLSMFIAQKKTKEIVIRKTMGASVMNIIIRLLRQFFGITIIANIIAIPLAYYFMDKWLQNFEYQSMMDYRIFIVAGTSSILLCLLTVSFHSAKAAILNPVEALKYE